MELVFSSLKVYMYMPCMRLFNLTASVKQLRLTGVYYYYYYYYCYYYYIIVSFMQGSHTHIPGTNHVPRGYIVAAILSLLFVVPLCLVPALALLFFYVSTFRSMCAVPNMAVFCSSLTSWFPRYVAHVFSE